MGTFTAVLSKDNRNRDKKTESEEGESASEHGDDIQ